MPSPPAGCGPVPRTLRGTSTRIPPWYYHENAKGSMSVLSGWIEYRIGGLLVSEG